MLTETQLAKAKVENENQISDAAVIKDYIESDLKSQSKKEMKQGVAYFNEQHDILKTDARVYIVEGQKIVDPNKSNNQLVNPFHKLLVKQKSGYIAGKAIVVDTFEETFTEKLNEQLEMKFDDILVDWIEGASNKGVEWIHPFINEEGEFDYVIIPAEQCIPIYDTSYQKRMQKFIRYYPIEVVKGKSSETRYKVELWDREKVTYYIEGENGEYELDDTEEINPKPHWYEYNTLTPQELQAKSWGKIPFIKLANNSQLHTDLRPIKKYIDAYDKVSSGFINDLEDIQMAIWILKGYEGTDLAEFMKNLITFKAIKTSGDEHSGVEAKTLEIPIEARKFMMIELEDKIYEIGQGVNMGTDKFGNSPSGVALQFLYSGLDSKANTMIRKLKKALTDFIWFVTEYINMTENASYKHTDVKFIINKTMITNETEQIENVGKSIGITSKKTALANHPWIDNVDDELWQINEEEKELMNKIDKNLGDLEDEEEDDEDTE